MSTAHPKRSAGTPPSALSEHARRRAEDGGLLAEKGDLTTVRISPRLLDAARGKLGLERTNDVVTAALSHVVYEDGFGEHLLGLRGLAGPDYMAELDRDESEDDGRPRG